MKPLFAIVMTFLLLSMPHARAQKRAMSLADLYQVRHVLNPQYSPDGRSVAFTVTSTDLAAAKSSTDIYMMAADGGSLRQLTFDDATDTGPQWSPDGRYLYFISTRSGSAQVWELNMAGGEARQLTDFVAGVNEPRIIGNAAQIVFYSEVYPECGADRDCHETADADLEGPMQAYMADDLMYRHWNFWKEGRRTHTFVWHRDEDRYEDLTPGDRDAPYYETGGQTGFDVSPDGREVCVVINADSNHWETTNKDVCLVPTGGGALNNITDANDAYAHPQYSPDGRYIAYLMQRIEGYESDLVQLALYDRKSGERRSLTASFDNWVGDFQWAPDSRSIYFTASVAGTTPIFNVAIASGKIREVTNLQYVDGFSVSPDNKHLVVARRSMGEPRELWRVATKGGEKKRLTTFNKALEDAVDFRPAESVWIDSPSGKKIHTLVVKPHGFDPARKYPLIVNVHGGPQGQWADAFRGDAQVYPGAGYVVAFPNPHGSSGYGQEFTRAISRDYAGKVYTDVMAVTDHLAALPYIDAQRIGAMGWSYGGYMMMWLEGHTTRFKAIAAMMGLYNLTSFYGTTEELWFPNFDLGGPYWASEDYQKWSPHLAAKNFQTPCLVITGQKDFRVSYTQSLEFFTALQKQGVPSRLIVFKNDGHWPSGTRSMPLYYNAHLEWFHQYLGGEPAPYDSRDMVRNRAFK